MYKSLFSINKPNQNLVSFTCSHCVGDFGTCVSSQRYGFVLFTTEVCVCSCMVFCIKMIWSDASLYRIDFTFVMNLLWFVSKQLVLKQLCIETTMNQIYCYIHTGYPKGNMNVNQQSKISGLSSLLIEQGFKQHKDLLLIHFFNLVWKL